MAPTSTFRLPFYDLFLHLAHLGGLSCHLSAITGAGNNVPRSGLCSLMTTHAMHACRKSDLVIV